MIVRTCSALLAGIATLGLSTASNAEGFAAMVSPPRFELGSAPGQMQRAVIEISNRSAEPARYRVHTADWTMSPDFSVQFQDTLQPGSCRPWVTIERPEVDVPGGATVRYRFEVSVPADAPTAECRFALLIDGADPASATANNIKVPVTGRIGVIVYVDVGDSAPKLEIFGPKVATLNGQRLPTLRVHNAGNAHGRITGFLTGTDAKGIDYEFMPSDFPILPQEEREVFLSASSATEERPTLTFPVKVKGTLEWGQKKTELNETFE